MKNWLKKITGVAEIEAAARAAEESRIRHEQYIKTLEEKKAAIEQETEAAKNELILSQMSQRDQATARGEPYIAVLDTKINPDNIRNGFFELDWNRYFIDELIANGYGTEADPEEEIVDRWFRDIVYQMLEEEGMDTSRGAGFINVNKLPGGKSSVS